MLRVAQSAAEAYDIEKHNAARDAVRQLKEQHSEVLQIIAKDSQTLLSSDDVAFVLNDIARRRGTDWMSSFCNSTRIRGQVKDVIERARVMQVSESDEEAIPASEEHRRVRLGPSQAQAEDVVMRMYCTLVQLTNDIDEHFHNSLSKAERETPSEHRAVWLDRQNHFAEHTNDENELVRSPVPCHSNACSTQMQAEHYRAN